MVIQESRPGRKINYGGMTLEGIRSTEIAVVGTKEVIDIIPYPENNVDGVSVQSKGSKGYYKREEMEILHGVDCILPPVETVGQEAPTKIPM